MNQPLGDLVGNAVEIVEAVQVLRGERPGRLHELSLALTGHLAVLAGIADTPEQGIHDATRTLQSGAGLERFRAFVQAQGGDPRVVDDLSLLPQAPVTVQAEGDRDGYLNAIDTVAIGRAAARLGAGRGRITDDIDPAVGLELLVHLGDRLRRGAPIARILARDRDVARAAGEQVRGALQVDDERADPPPLVHHIVAGEPHP